MNCPQCNAHTFAQCKILRCLRVYKWNDPTPAPNAISPHQTHQNQQYQQQTGEAFHFDTDGRGQGRGYTWEIIHQGAFALSRGKSPTRTINFCRSRSDGFDVFKC